MNDGNRTIDEQVARLRAWQETLYHETMPGDAADTIERLATAMRKALDEDGKPRSWRQILDEALS